MKTLEISPGYLEAHFNRSPLYFTEGAGEKAAFHLRKIIEIDPSSALARQVLAQVFQSQKALLVISENAEK